MWPRRSAPSRSRRTSCSRPSSRRRAAARSCGGCCATWRRTGRSATRRRSPIRRSSARSSTVRKRSRRRTLDSPRRGGTMLDAMESLQQTELMSIGRFARLTGLTVKALRHYDELGLLRPASVDPETGYRSYGAEQVQRADAIRKLRSLELPLDDVSILLDTNDSALLHRVLVDHQRRT